MSDAATAETPLPDYDRRPPRAGVLQTLAPGVRRLVVNNPGPFTFTGTCSYILGEGRVVMVDPGPDLPRAAESLLAMLPGENVEAILITHTHRDHSPAARPLQRLTGAPIIGAAAHHPARPPRTGEQHHLDASADSDHRPDRVLADGDRLAMAGMEIEVIATPGHTMNHLCFALAGRDMLLSGDHVMGWSTSIVAPPDGSMGAYMASLDKLRSRSETRYLPGHGEVLAEAPRFVRGLLAHRRQRETSILSHLRAGLRSTQALVLAMYEGLDPSLRGAAALSVLAHLEDLVERGLVRCEDQPGHGAVFHPR